MGKQPSSRDMATFNMEMANLVRSGLPISEGLKHISKEVRSATFRSQLEKIREKLEQGTSLSEAMTASGAFSAYYLSLIRAGEAAGNLADVLYHLTRYSYLMYRTTTKIKLGMVYPLAQLGIAAVIFGFILVFIVPKFIELYEGAGAELPGVTQVIVNLSILLVHHTWETLGKVILIGVCLYLLIRFPLRSLWDQGKLFIPIFGKVVKWRVLTHYCEVLGFMLKQGLPIMDALKMAAMTTKNKSASQAFYQIAERVESGSPLSAQMNQHRIFPPSLVWMVSAGKQQERLDQVLLDNATFYMEQMDDWAERMSWVMQPFLILLIALPIAFIIIALYMPLFKVGDVIK